MSSSRDADAKPTDEITAMIGGQRLQTVTGLTGKVTLNFH